MDWVLFIFLGVGLPSIGGAFSAYMVFRKYSELKARSQEMGTYESEFRYIYGKYIIIQTHALNPIVFGLLIVSILWTATTEMVFPEEAFTNVALASTLAIGMTGLFRNIVGGVIARKGLEAIVNDPMNFGKVMVHTGIPDMTSIFGLLVAILALMGSGVLGSEFTASLQQSQDILTLAVIFSCASAGILLSVVLFSKVVEPYSASNFMRGILMNSTGNIIPMIGLLYAIIRFYEIGIL